MKLMVIDGNSIVNRAFYGVSQNLTTREGLPTNAIFGFLNILFKLLDEEEPEGLAVAFNDIDYCLKVRGLRKAGGLRSLCAALSL